MITEYPSLAAFKKDSLETLDTSTDTRDIVYGSSANRLPFSSYDEIYATIQYDSMLKNLLYGKMMYIETAVKNVALESILQYVNSESIQDMYDKAVSSYRNCPIGYTTEQKKKAQQNKLNLEGTIQSCLTRAYKS